MTFRNIFISVLLTGLLTSSCAIKKGVKPGKKPCNCPEFKTKYSFLHHNKPNDKNKIYRFSNNYIA
jgi:hypothetical protein